MSFEDNAVEISEKHLSGTISVLDKLKEEKRSRTRNIFKYKATERQEKTKPGPKEFFSKEITTPDHPELKYSFTER